jgi:hypothetical protein
MPFPHIGCKCHHPSRAEDLHQILVLHKVVAPSVAIPDTRRINASSSTRTGRPAHYAPPKHLPEVFHTIWQQNRLALGLPRKVQRAGEEDRDGHMSKRVAPTCTCATPHAKVARPAIAPPLARVNFSHVEFLDDEGGPMGASGEWSCELCDSGVYVDDSSTMSEAIVSVASKGQRIPMSFTLKDMHSN